MRGSEIPDPNEVKATLPAPEIPTELPGRRSLARRVCQVGDRSVVDPGAGRAPNDPR